MVNGEYPVLIVNRRGRQRAGGQIWQIWFAPMFQSMADNDEIVRGLSYINVDWDSQPMWGPPYESGYWGDTRLETHPDLAERFNKAVTAWRQSD